MKKKLFLIVSLCILMLSLAACGSESKETDYNGVTKDQLELNSQQLASTLVAMTDEDIEGYITQSGDTVTINLVSRWRDLKPEIGEFIDLGDFSVDKSGKTLTTTQIMKFTNRDLTLTFVYQYYDMSLQDITIDENYSVGEKMQKAGMNTLMGLGTVFMILILISLIINCFKAVPALQQKWEARYAGAAVTPEVNAAPVSQTEAVVEEVLEQNELELIAVIAAAIAAATQTTTDDFVVRSIKRR